MKKRILGSLPRVKSKQNNKSSPFPSPDKTDFKYSFLHISQTQTLTDTIKNYWSSSPIELSDVIISFLTYPLDHPCDYLKWASDHAKNYGPYEPGIPSEVPSFPCQNKKDCTYTNRICNAHKYVLFVKVWSKVDTSSIIMNFEIPYGRWEAWGWYRDRIHEKTNIPLSDMTITFAGGYVTDYFKRHSGLQLQSTIHVLI